MSATFPAKFIDSLSVVDRTAQKDTVKYPLLWHSTCRFHERLYEQVAELVVVVNVKVFAIPIAFLTLVRHAFTNNRPRISYCDLA
jgi:hypothetical protein